MAKRLTKSSLLEAINNGCAKSRKSPHYKEEYTEDGVLKGGVLHERFGVTQNALKVVFENNKDLADAYAKQAHTKTTSGKAKVIELIDDLAEVQEDVPQENLPEVDVVTKTEPEPQVNDLPFGDAKEEAPETPKVEENNDSIW